MPGCEGDTDGRRVGESHAPARIVVIGSIRQAQVLPVLRHSDFDELHSGAPGHDPVHIPSHRPAHQRDLQA